jgi:hypothetical protein
MKIFVLSLLLLTPLAAATDEPWTLTYTTSGGFTGRTDTVLLRSDGSMERRTGAGDAEKVTCRQQTPAAAKAPLAAAVAKAAPDAWQAKYQSRWARGGAADMTAATLTLQRGAHEKSAAWTEGAELPADIQALLAALAPAGLGLSECSE